MKIHLLVLFAMLGTLSMAQSVKYDYDNSGNRILREPGIPLPVTLISFTASKDSEELMAILTWQTAEEVNADRFDIERSRDGKKWVIIGTVRAHGEAKTGSFYSFADSNPMDGQTRPGENLYRLKMIDRASGDHKDGTFAYSRIQSVFFESLITLYPNPVNDLIKIEGHKAGKVELLNNAGKAVYQSDTIPAAGIDMTKLPTGVYLVRIEGSDGSVLIRKVVKQ